jgi:hypothetical protein
VAAGEGSHRPVALAIVAEPLLGDDLLVRADHHQRVARLVRIDPDHDSRHRRSPCSKDGKGGQSYFRRRTPLLSHSRPATPGRSSTPLKSQAICRATSRGAVSTDTGAEIRHNPTRPSQAVSGGSTLKGMSGRFRKSLDQLERGVRVPREAQVESQATEPPHEFMSPEDLDQMMLLANPAGAGRLKPRD